VGGFLEPGDDLGEAGLVCGPEWTPFPRGCDPCKHHGEIDRTSVPKGALRKRIKGQHNPQARQEFRIRLVP
jgi:hypothetical protein